MPMKLPLLLWVYVCLLFAPGELIAQSKTTEAGDATIIHQTIKKITDIIVYDVFSPPVASRTYAYVSIAGYEAMRTDTKETVSLTASLNGFKTAINKQPAQVNHTIAAVQAMLKVATAMVVSEDSIQAYNKKLIESFKTGGVSNHILTASVEYGNSVAQRILSWAALDQYKQTRSYPRHMLTTEEGSWKPTPPGYMKAIEPHWNRMRPFMIDSAAQFKPEPAIAFSTATDSRFFKDAKEVWETAQHLTDEQREIANFWDCNPFKLNVSGHVMTTYKKISPGGHWMNITALACKQRQWNSLRSLEAYTMVSIVLADAFISCWDEKYRSLVIRPETFINEYLDAAWMPILQTPPFPEYPSGHSVVSAAAATVLTTLFGNNFSYLDDTELEFGLPARSYHSFEQAAKEAAISRLYGGIHYRPAIDNGLVEGKALAAFTLLKWNYKSAE